MTDLVPGVGDGMDVDVSAAAPAAPLDASALPPLTPAVSALPASAAAGGAASAAGDVAAGVVELPGDDDVEHPGDAVLAEEGLVEAGRALQLDLADQGIARADAANLDQPPLAAGGRPAAASACVESASLDWAPARKGARIAEAQPGPWSQWRRTVLGVAPLSTPAARTLATPAPTHVAWPLAITPA